MVSSYKVKYNSETGFYEIISSVTHRCPYCGTGLSHRDYVERKAKNIYGERKIYQLRRLACCGCGKTHRELPDFIQPYKHYEAAAIQSVIDNDEEACLCDADNSTMWRWRRDYSDSEPDISQRLASVQARMSGGKVQIFTADEILLKIKSDKERWLPYVMELLINSGHKICTRFAFCQPVTCAKVASGSKKHAEGGRNYEQAITDTG